MAIRVTSEHLFCAFCGRRMRQMEFSRTTRFDRATGAPIVTSHTYWACPLFKPVEGDELCNGIDGCFNSAHGDQHRHDAVGLSS